MRKVGTIENNQIVYSSSSVESSEIDGSVAWSPETGDTKPHVLINFPTKARVIAIKVQGGPDGYIEKFQIGFKETQEFQYIRDTNHKIVNFILLSQMLFDILKFLIVFIVVFFL